MHRVEKGLVLRAVDYRDADTLLTILTECHGKITAAARGVRRKSSRISAAVQSLAYSEFTLYESGSKFSVNEAEAIELFYDLRVDLVNLALANYFAEVLEQAADEEIANPELLRLGLNSLFALTKGLQDIRIIKAAFELKIACYSGYTPNLSTCASCNGSFSKCQFDVSHGVCFCPNCARGQYRIDSGTLSAMRYIVNADVKKLFSFRLSEEGLKTLCDICEHYLKNHFERDFKTLAFYKSIL